jgi:hypothetical protein
VAHDVHLLPACVPTVMLSIVALGFDFGNNLSHAMLHFHFLDVPAAHELIPWFQDVL